MDSVFSAKNEKRAGETVDRGSCIERIVVLSPLKVKFPMRSATSKRGDGDRDSFSETVLSALEARTITNFLRNEGVACTARWVKEKGLGVSPEKPYVNAGYYCMTADMATNGPLIARHGSEGSLTKKGWKKE